MTAIWCMLGTDLSKTCCGQRHLPLWHAHSRSCSSHWAHYLSSRVLFAEADQSGTPIQGNDQACGRRLGVQNACAERERFNKMETIEELIQRVQKTRHGFLDIQKAADEVVRTRSREASPCRQLLLRRSTRYARWHLHPGTSGSPLKESSLSQEACEPDKIGGFRDPGKAFDGTVLTSATRRPPCYQGMAGGFLSNVRRAVTEA